MRRDLLLILIILGVIITLGLTNSVLAQGDPPPPPPCWPPESCIPINGGIWMLLLAGLIFGGYTAYFKTKTNEV